MRSLASGLVALFLAGAPPLLAENEPAKKHDSPFQDTIDIVNENLDNIPKTIRGPASPSEDEGVTSLRKSGNKMRAKSEDEEKKDPLAALFDTGGEEESDEEESFLDNLFGKETESPNKAGEGTQGTNLSGEEMKALAQETKENPIITSVGQNDKGLAQGDYAVRFNDDGTVSFSGAGGSKTLPAGEIKAKMPDGSIQYPKTAAQMSECMRRGGQVMIGGVG